MKTESHRPDRPDWQAAPLPLEDAEQPEHEPHDPLSLPDLEDYSLENLLQQLPWYKRTAAYILSFLAGALDRGANRKALSYGMHNLVADAINDRNRVHATVLSAMLRILPAQSAIVRKLMPRNYFVIGALEMHSTAVPAEFVSRYGQRIPHLRAFHSFENHMAAGEEAEAMELVEYLEAAGSIERPAGAALLIEAYARLRRDEQMAHAITALMRHDVPLKPAILNVLGNRCLYAGLIEQGVDIANRYARTYALQAANSQTLRTLMVFCRNYRVLDQALGQPDESHPGHLLPERLVQYVARHAPRHQSAKPDTILLVSSSLAAGGAERQYAATAVSLMGQRVRDAVDGREGTCCPVALVRYASPLNRSDFFRPVLERAKVPLQTLFNDEDRIKELLVDLAESGADQGLFGLIPPPLRQTTMAYFATFRRESPKVVHLWQDETNILGGLAAVMAGVPRIVLSTRSHRPIKLSRYRRYLWASYRFLIALPWVTLTNNSSSGARDYEAWLDLPPGTVGVIHNGLDLAGFSAPATPAAVADVRRGLGVPDGAPLIGGCMRMSEEKRPALWMEAAVDLARRVPEAHFVCVGDGPQKQALAARIRAEGLGSRIHLPGSISPVSPWLAACDVVLNTSAIEGMPNVVIEAQSLGVPVVATDVGGTAEVVIDGTTGYLVPPDDVGALTSVTAMVIGDPTFRARAGEAARRHVGETFSIEVMRTRTLAAYGLEKT